MKKLMSKKLMGTILTASLAMFLFGCGTAPTAVATPDNGGVASSPDPPGDGEGDGRW